MQDLRYHLGFNRWGARTGDFPKDSPSLERSSSEAFCWDGRIKIMRLHALRPFQKSILKDMGQGSQSAGQTLLFRNETRSYSRLQQQKL